MQGDVTEIYDANGNLKVKYGYDAYGNCVVLNGTTDTTLANANPIRYRGYYFDTETGLYYLNSRYYNPEWRRFISPDDTAYIDPESVNGLNLYCYCNNDPVNFVDPSGHFVISATAVLIGLAIGATVGLGAAAVYDYYDDGAIFNGSVGWQTYLGATVLGGALGALFGSFWGLSIPITFPTGFALMQTSIGTTTAVISTATVSVAVSDVLAVAGALGAVLMFASNNRPRNNTVQNKQFHDAARKAGYNPNNPRIKDQLEQVHRYIRDNNLNLGWDELVNLIKEWLG